MFHRHTAGPRRTDFLSVLVLVVGVAFLLTVAFQAHAALDPCADAQAEAAVLDSSPLLNTGALACRTESTSASWVSAIWGAFTH